MFVVGVLFLLDPELMNPTTSASRSMVFRMLLTLLFGFSRLGVLLGCSLIQVLFSSLLDRTSVVSLAGRVTLVGTTSSVLVRQARGPSEILLMWLMWILVSCILAFPLTLLMPGKDVISGQSLCFGLASVLAD